MKFHFSDYGQKVYRRAGEIRAVESRIRFFRGREKFQN